MPARIYVSKKTNAIYPLKEDESEIDMDNPVNVDIKAYYKETGHNNMFTIYDLKKAYKTR